MSNKTARKPLEIFGKHAKLLTSMEKPTIEVTERNGIHYSSVNDLMDEISFYNVTSKVKIEGDEAVITKSSTDNNLITVTKENDLRKVILTNKNAKLVSVIDKAARRISFKVLGRNNGDDVTCVELYLYDKNTGDKAVAEYDSKGNLSNITFTHSFVDDEGRVKIRREVDTHDTKNMAGAISKERFFIYKDGESRPYRSTSIVYGFAGKLNKAYNTDITYIDNADVDDKDYNPIIGHPARAVIFDSIVTSANTLVQREVKKLYYEKSTSRLMRSVDLQMTTDGKMIGGHIYDYDEFGIIQYNLSFYESYELVRDYDKIYPKNNFKDKFPKQIQI